jgi:hypothetical protein
MGSTQEGCHLFACGRDRGGVGVQVAVFGERTANDLPPDVCGDPGMVVTVRSYFIYRTVGVFGLEGEVGIVPPTTIAALIGASGVLLGLVVGRFWDVRSELRKWRWDQKIQAYQRLAEAFFVMRENLRATAETEPETSDAKNLIWQLCAYS